MQDKTIGVIYAEHHEPGKRFTAGHEEAVAFLCAQAAAPLWNFQLEARLRAADEYRRSLIDVQSRFVPNELLRILDIDDLRRVRSGYRVERRMTVLISDIRGYTTMLEDMNVSEASNLAMGFLRGRRSPDRQLQRHDSGCARGRDRRRVRVGSETPSGRGSACCARCASTTARGWRTAPRSCRRESASTPGRWESGSSVE